MTLPTLNQNQFALQPVLGDIDMQFTGTVIAAAAATGNTGSFVPGQPVKIENSAGGVPKFVPLTANTDDTFGFVVRNLKDASIAAGKSFELAMKESVIFLASGAAIARGANVEVVYDANSGAGSVITAAGINPVVGKALDKATAADQLIRVFLNVPSTNPNPINTVRTAVVSATLAEINAGKVLIPGVSGKAITVISFVERVTGTFTTATAIVLASDNGTPVVVGTEAIAGVTNGAVILPSDTNMVLGAGFGVPLGSGDGLKVTKTGSTAAGGTSISFTINYVQA